MTDFKISPGLFSFNEIYTDIVDFLLFIPSKYKSAFLLLLVYLSDVVPASQTHFDLHENCSEAYLLALLLLFWFH